MNVTGPTYFLAALFWTLTTLYGVLTSQAFIQQQFLAPRLIPALAAFADWHGAIGILVLAAWGAARRQTTLTSRPGVIWTTGIAWLAVTLLLMDGMPLSESLSTPQALLIVGTGVMMIVLVALSECQTFAAASENAPRDRGTADLLACLLAAGGVTIAYAGATIWGDGVSPALVADLLASLRLHLLVAGAVFLTLSALRGGAALSARPLVAEAGLSIAVLAVAVAAFVSTVLLASISIRGPVSIAVGAAVGIALAFAVGARGTGALGQDGVAAAMRALSPRVVAHWWGLAVWALCLLAVAILVTAASRTMDWNFVLLRSGIALTWLLALSATFSFSARFADGGSRLSFAAVALLLGAHAALQTAAVPVQASSVKNASGRWLAELLEHRVEVEGAGEHVQFLHARTNIPRDTEVAAVDVTLADLAGPPAAVRPHVFVFVVDSLRRDYLSPYNPAVTFTPAIDAFAHDSLVFRNAFTQYGATGLSVPSFWVGGPILHKQYVSSFPRMNTLAALLAHEQYEPWISTDHIMNVILPPLGNSRPLDAGVQVKDFRLCSTLDQIRSRLAQRPSTAPPVFAYSLPQDVHISVLTREGAGAVDDGAYTGFYAPVASRLHRLDGCFGEFINDLKAQGLYDQSIIILTSDHGDSLGEGGRMGHAYSLDPEVVRVPLIVHVPSAVKSAWAWNESRAAFTTDVTPTLYRLLGKEPGTPASFFGESLALPPGAPQPAPRARMIAASYGPVYGALLDGASRYYVFDAISMREAAFELGEGLEQRQVTVTPQLRDRGVQVIRDTVGGISTFYRFPTSPDSGS